LFFDGQEINQGVVLQDLGNVQVFKILNNDISPRIDVSFGKIDESIFSDLINERSFGLGDMRRGLSNRFTLLCPSPFTRHFEGKIWIFRF